MFMYTPNVTINHTDVLYHMYRLIFVYTYLYMCLCVYREKKGELKFLP